MDPHTRGVLMGTPQKMEIDFIDSESIRVKISQRRSPSDGDVSGLGRLIDFHQATVLHIVNVTIDRDVLRH